MSKTKTHDSETFFRMPPSDVNLSDPSEVAKLIERVFSTPLELKRTSSKDHPDEPDTPCPQPAKAIKG